MTDEEAYNAAKKPANEMGDIFIQHPPEVQRAILAILTAGYVIKESPSPIHDDGILGSVVAYTMETTAQLRKTLARHGITISRTPVTRRPSCQA